MSQTLKRALLSPRRMRWLHDPMWSGDLKGCKEGRDLLLLCVPYYAPSRSCSYLSFVNRLAHTMCPSPPDLSFRVGHTS